MKSGDSSVLSAIVRSSLRHSGVVIVLACLMVVYGLYSLSKAKYGVFPEFAPPQVVIQAEAPGLSPEQVEALVTQPVENAVNGVPGIETLRSSSIQGLSLITVTFVPGSDIYRNRQAVTERLSSVAGQLPLGVKPPVMTPLTSSTSVIMAVGLTSEKRTLMELRTVADWTVKQRLLAVPGVSKIAVFGGDVKQLQVQIRPERLVKYNLSADDVLRAARVATGIRGAGFIDTANQRMVLQAEGQSIKPEELAGTVLLHRGGTNVTLGDVAQVAEAPEPPIGAAAIMGKAGVQLVVSEQYGANTLEVTGKVEKALGEIRPSLAAEGIELHADIFRPANFIQTAIRNIGSSLLIGSVLVVVVLFLFLFNLRTAAISCTAIPLSLLAAITVMEYFGYSLNTMTLGGLAIAVGMVVDDAVIDVENIFRRLRENRHLARPRPIFAVVLDASIEVREAVVYATFAVALVFIPVLTMSGVAGRLFAPLGTSYILATLASLLVALTVTPALCLVFLGGKEASEKEPPVVRWLKERYRSLLLNVERHPRAVIGGVAALTAGGLAVLPFFGGGFLPELREGHFIVHMSAVPGTSLAESLRIGDRMTRELLKIPYVRSVAQRAGRAEKSDDVYGTHYSELNVDLKPLKGEEAELAQSDIRRALAQFPGVNFAVKTFLTERVEETLTGYTASVAINLFGNDLDTLDGKAREVAEALGKVRGATEVQVQSPPGAPQLVVRLRKGDLARWGFDAVSVLEAIRTAYEGDVVGQTYEGNRVFDVSVILDPRERNSVAAIGSLPLRNPAGTYVELSRLADIYEASGRYVVLHEGARRVQTVTCNVAGRDVNSFVADARRKIAETVRMPSGTYLEFGGTAEAQARSRRDLIIHSLLAGVGVILLLSIVIGGSRNLLLVLANVPFALVGGVLAVFAFGGGLSLGSLVGFVTLFGITLRNSIMMVSNYEHLVVSEGMAWGRDAAIRGATERLAPILMTALVTGLGLLPLAIGSGAPGREIEGPMAIVILGGLLTSTLLNLLVLPTLALRFGRFRKD
ncbi:MAG: efflux RND transporter permease subunit [Desulfobacteraceae bacterium]|nr:efflux RND transporter permease subunit [Desulfobacteraceae bacterium]